MCAMSVKVNIEVSFTNVGQTRTRSIIGGRHESARQRNYDTDAVVREIGSLSINDRKARTKASLSPKPESPTIPRCETESESDEEPVNAEQPRVRQAPHTPKYPPNSVPNKNGLRRVDESAACHSRDPTNEDILAGFICRHKLPVGRSPRLSESDCLSPESVLSASSNYSSQPSPSGGSTFGNSGSDSNHLDHLREQQLPEKQEEQQQQQKEKNEQQEIKTVRKRGRPRKTVQQKNQSKPLILPKGQRDLTKFGITIPMKQEADKVIARSKEEIHDVDKNGNTLYHRFANENKFDLLASLYCHQLNTDTSLSLTLTSPAINSTNSMGQDALSIFVNHGNYQAVRFCCVLASSASWQQLLRALAEATMLHNDDIFKCVLERLCRELHSSGRIQQAKRSKWLNLPLTDISSDWIPISKGLGDLLSLSVTELACITSQHTDRLRLLIARGANPFKTPANQFVCKNAFQLAATYSTDPLQALKALNGEDLESLGVDELKTCLDIIKGRKCNCRTLPADYPTEEADALIVDLRLDPIIPEPTSDLELSEILSSMYDEGH